MPLGFFIFSLGLIIAVIGGAKPAIEIGAWPDSTYYFVIGAVVASLGVYLWRASIRKEVEKIKSGSNAEGTHVDVLKHVEKLKTALADFKNKYTHYNAEDLNLQTEAFLDEFMLPVVEQRYDFIHRFGMTNGAEVVLELAKAERYMNRVQTAAIDGELAEAHKSFPIAEAAFNDAFAKLAHM